MIKVVSGKDVVLSSEESKETEIPPTSNLWRNMMRVTTHSVFIRCSNLTRAVLIVCIMTLLPTPSYADMKHEIDHLLGFIRESPCEFERNGKLYGSADAYEHIVRKYKYYSDDIKSGEDFISLSATKSMMSGEKYKVRCPGVPPQTSEQWLLDELKRYRHKAGLTN